MRIESPFAGNAKKKISLRGLESVLLRDSETKTGVTLSRNELAFFVQRTFSDSLFVSRHFYRAHWASSPFFITIVNLRPKKGARAGEPSCRGPRLWASPPWEVPPAMWIKLALSPKNAIK